ncbi:MAG TPA: hypothetical protein VHL57_09370, partial [Flavobacteriales bacterium]|nr:hypothetical protein [Flavobacteriales bacterium]
GFILKYLPRFLGFSCFTVMGLAFVRASVGLNAWVAFGIVLLWWWWFRQLEKWSRRITRRTAMGLIKSRWRIDPTRRRSVLAAFSITCAIIVVGVLLAACYPPWGTLAGLFLTQAAYTVQVCCRRAWAQVLTPPRWWAELVAGIALFRRRDAHDAEVPAKGRPPLFGRNELYYFLFFNVLAALVFALFVAANYSVRWAVWLGPMAIVLFGLSILLGSLNLLRLLARQLHVNLFFFALVLIVLFGLLWDPHTVRTVAIATGHPRRPQLTERFRTWLHAREAEINVLPDTARYPVLLVMSDGGASRSGYWVAAVLARLEEESGGRFGRHLFSLSGASGGSVGNATFLALMADTAGRKHVLEHSRAILEQDMLSPALANMLGADMLHFLVPVLKGRDRAAALEQALSVAGGVVDDSLFDRPFDHFINDSLPVFMVNTTRMQDARAAVMSNVQIAPALFNRRLDVLGRMAKDTTMRLGTAVILGARFPYVSPAGQLIGHMPDGRASHDQYVDGGYFDNSGAGVTQEMLLALIDAFGRDTLFGRLDVHVLHITNGIATDTIARKPSLPLLNDLAAPIITIAGAYGSQTDINDRRLYHFMQRLTGDSLHYHELDVYSALPKGTELSMSWAISNKQLALMDSSLVHCAEIDRVLKLLER